MELANILEQELGILTLIAWMVGSSQVSTPIVVAHVSTDTLEQIVEFLSAAPLAKMAKYVSTEEHPQDPLETVDANVLDNTLELTANQFLIAM